MRVAGGWPLWTHVAVHVAAATGCALVPIAARPGYESSLVLAPLGALSSGLLAVHIVTSARQDHPAASFGRLTARAAIAALAGPGAALVVLLAAGAVRGLCDPVWGLAFFALGPVACALAASVVGVVAALAVPGRRLAHLAVLAVLAASLAFDAWLVYATPQVFVFDHLLGHFAGPLYDENIPLGLTHLMFRIHTLARIAPVAALAAALHDSARARLVFTRIRTPRALVSAGLLAVLLVATFVTEPRWGLRTSEGAIRRALGATTETAHLVIHHPAGLDAWERSLTAADAELAFRQLEDFFGGAPSRKLVVYMFPDAATMRRMTGTGPTSVAKPWLGATTVVYQSAPHGVLKHEMAHLFSAAWAPGPLRTPGRLWGLLADPLMLEGTAVAADWDSDPLDPHAQAAALVRAQVIEDPAAIAGLGFFTHQGGVSYLLSGSFVRWLRDTHGAAPIRAWYSGVPFDEAFGESMDAALGSWKGFLAARDVPDPWVASAKLHHSRPSMFQRPCPHQVAGIYARAGLALAGGDALAADAQLARACTIAPGDVPLTLTRLRLALARGEPADAARLLDELRASPLAEGALKPQILEAAGDVAWLEGDHEQAARQYEEALDLTPEDAGRRMLAIKRWACTWPADRFALRDTLLGVRDPEDGEDRNIARLARLAMDHPDVAELHYLHGRALFNAGRHEQAAASLARAAAQRMCDVIVQGEAYRLLAWARLHAGDVPGARAAVDDLIAMPPPSPALAFQANQVRQLLEALE